MHTEITDQDQVWCNVSFLLGGGGAVFVDTRHKENRKRRGHLRPVHILQKQNVTCTQCVPLPYKVSRTPNTVLFMQTHKTNTENA